MEKEKLSEHLVSVTSEKEASFLLSEFQEQTAEKAINFILKIFKKQKDLKNKRIKEKWLGDKKQPGLLQEIRNKYTSSNN